MRTRSIFVHASLFVGLLMLGATLGRPTDAQSQRCTFDSPNRVLVSLDRRDGKVVFDNARTREDLSRLQRRSGRGPALRGVWTSIGLTQTELQYQVAVRIEAFQMSDGRYCGRLTAVEASLGYDVLQVYIARRYRPGTCQYNSIVTHEMTHVAVFRDGLDTFFPRMQHRLERTANNASTLKATTPDAVARQFQRRLRGAVDPLFKEMNRTLDRNNALLDTPERYRIEQTRCPSW